MTVTEIIAHLREVKPEGSMKPEGFHIWNLPVSKQIGNSRWRQSLGFRATIRKPSWVTSGLLSPSLHTVVSGDAILQTLVATSVFFVVFFFGRRVQEQSQKSLTQKIKDVSILPVRSHKKFSRSRIVIGSLSRGCV